MSPLEAFLWSIGQQESGGNYTDVNTSSGALGKYQVMPANVAGWTKEALGTSLTPAQYLADPAAQDAVAKKILGGYYTKYGAAGAASAWYSGNPSLATDTAPQHGGPSIASYVNEVLSRANKALTGKAQIPTTPTPTSTSTGTTSASGGAASATDASATSLAGDVLGALSPITLLGSLTGTGSALDRDLSKLLVSGAALTAAAALVVIGLVVAVRPTGDQQKPSGGDLAGAAKLAEVAA